MPLKIRNPRKKRTAEIKESTRKEETKYLREILELKEELKNRIRKIPHH